MDFNAGVNHFFQRFVSDSEKYILLGLIAIELYNDNKLPPENIAIYKTMG